jgi:ferritin-like metal-binding protein YciE
MSFPERTVTGRNDKLLSVCICTHDRSESLASCLRALREQTANLPITIVDSACSAPQKATLETIASTYDANLIRLDSPGLSLARNAGLAAADSTWIAFLDDDTIPSNSWAAEARRICSQAPSDCAVIGGPALPCFPPDREVRLGKRWLQLLSVIDLPGEGDRTRSPSVVGANVLFRSETVRQIGGFPLSLGRIGTSLSSGEEKFVLETLRNCGHRIWYSHKLRVEHCISPDRLTRAWVIRRSYWDGVSDRRIELLMGRRSSAVRHLKIFLSIPVLALLYPFRSQHEFFIRFWYNFGWLCSSSKGLPMSGVARDALVLGLRNAHVMEVQARELLERQSGQLDDYPDVEAKISSHLRKTNEQLQRLEKCLEFCGESTSNLKDAATSIVTNSQAMGHAMADDDILKNTFTDNAFENYQIAAYKSLLTLCRAANVESARPLLDASLKEEEAMAEWVDSHIEEITMDYLNHQQRKAARSAAFPKPSVARCAAAPPSSP